MNTSDYRAIILGSPWGGTRQQVEDLIDYYGVRENVTLLENIPPPQVNSLLNKSKVLLLLSLKEGGNKSIIESLFAGTPILLLNEHRGIKSEWINDDTGRLTPLSELASALTWFRTEYARFSLREWAMDNLSCHVSTRKLEDCLKQISHSRGDRWTRSLVVKMNRGWKPDYYDENQRLPAFDFEKYRKANRQQNLS